MGCALSDPDLTRLIDLELTAVVRSGAGRVSYDVGIVCAAESVIISIHDPVTGKRLERSLQLPPPGSPEPERLVALSAAQLYRASWFELLARDSPPLPPARSESPPPASVIEGARKMAAPHMQSPFQPFLFAAAGVRARAVSQPLWMPGGRVSAGVRSADGWYVGAFAGIEATRATRDTGAVRVVLIEGGLLGGRQLKLSERYSWLVEGAVSGVEENLAGEDVQPGLRTGEVNGFGLDMSLRTGPSVRLGEFSAAAVLSGGALMKEPQGMVLGGTPVSVNGAWVGLELRMAWIGL